MNKTTTAFNAIFRSKDKDVVVYKGGTRRYVHDAILLTGSNWISADVELLDSYFFRNIASRHGLICLAL